MKTKFLKKIGFLFAVTLMFANFVSMKVQAVTLMRGESLMGGDVINYDGTIYLFDQREQCIDSAPYALTIKDTYTTIYSEYSYTLFPSRIMGVRETPEYVNVYVDFGQLGNYYGCNHNLTYKFNNDINHRPECANCGIGLHEPHDYGNGINAPCRGCGYTCAHEWKYDGAISCHIATCKKCFFSYREEHAYSDGPECSICGYKESVCNHVWEVRHEYPKKPDTHVVQCSLCLSVKQENHIFENGIDGTCLACGIEVIYVINSTETTDIKAPETAALTDKHCKICSCI